MPNKNIRELHGKPLMAYTIEQALESGLFEHVVVSTDSDIIAKTARKYGAECWFSRPPELATDNAAKIPVIRHALMEAENHYNQKFDILMDLDATSPLRKTEDITHSFDQFIKSDSDILITGCEARKNPYFNMVEVDNSGKVRVSKKLPQGLVRRQDAPKVYDMNASIYIWRRNTLIHNDTLFTERTSLYEMPEERSIDIDSNLEWEIVEYLLGKRLSDGKHN